MKIPLVITLESLAAVVLIGVGAMSLGYFPGLSRSLGFGGPRDLGVTYSESDLQSAQDKIASPESEKQFSDAELTALFNACQGSACFMKDVQVSTHTDGTFEFSGAMQREKIESFLAAASLSGQEAASVQAALLALPKEPKVYMKARVEGEEDVITVQVLSATMASLPVPPSAMEQMNQEIARSMNGYLAALPGTQIRFIRVGEQGVEIDADFSAFDF